MADRPPSDDRWSVAWSLSLAAFLIGFAVQLNFGQLDPGAILLVTLALPLAVVGVARPDWRLIRARNVRFALGAVLMAQIGMLVVWPPGAGPAVQDAATLLPFRVGVAAAGALALIELSDRRALARLRMPALLGFWLVAAAWVVVNEPRPPSDVWWFQQLGGQALLDGVNPYAIEMPNIYAPDTSLYAPGTAHGTQLDFGLLYPPMSLFLGLPGFVLYGDVRFAHLAVVVVAAGLMATMRAGPIARGAALLFLFTPRGFFVVEQGWTDPQTVLGVTLVAWLAIRQVGLVPPALGLAMAVKQHLALLLPLALLLARPMTWGAARRLALVAIVTAAVVTLPLALWDAPGFWHSVVEMQFIQPFRTDALSYLAWLQLDDPRLAVIGFATLIPTGLFVWWRAARTPAGFAASVALVYLFFIAFNKQAFANYYYFVIGVMCCAIAATWPSGGLGPDKPIGPMAPGS
jgi:hypothetical protein